MNALWKSAYLYTSPVFTQASVIGTDQFGRVVSIAWPMIPSQDSVRVVKACRFCFIFRRARFGFSRSFISPGSFGAEKSALNFL
jgi:hypothetical protein